MVAADCFTLPANATENAGQENAGRVNDEQEILRWAE